MKITDDIVGIYSKPLPSSRSGPLYNAFSYPTKISPEAIAVFIATHTRPGESVLDVFGGSGTTGMAAQLCDRPTKEMLKMAEALGVEPIWGPRKAILYEISSLGAFVSKTLTSQLEPDEFELAAKKLLKQSEDELDWIYRAEDPNGIAGKIRYSIWSDVLLCPSCAAEIPYWDAAVRWDPLQLVKFFKCPHCTFEESIDKCDRAIESVEDPILAKTIVRKKRVLARIYGKSDSGNWNREPLPSDLNLHERAAGFKLPKMTPNEKVFWGDLHRSGYHKGITHLHHFYTPRNFLVISTLWKNAMKFPESVCDALRMLILSYNATHSTLMTRVVVKKNQSELVLTGAQSGVLYISGLPVEKNIFEGVRRKIGSFKKAYAVIYGSRSPVRVVNKSSTDLLLDDESVDYVFTDPPFGDYIPYAEINQINEYWLGKVTDKSEEIIISRSQEKGVDEYGQLMRDVFSEISRVLKPAGFATVVFHSASSSVWKALTDAYLSAGLAVLATSVLDKIQASFKQVVSTVSVKGDPLILLSKGRGAERGQGITAEDIAIEILGQADLVEPSEQSVQRLYSRFISRCLENKVPVHIDAREFYARAKEK